MEINHRFEWKQMIGDSRSLRRRVATVVVVLLAVVLAYGVVAGADGLAAYHQKRTEDHVLEQQIQKLQQDNSRLKDRVQRLTNDPNTIEHEARKMLHYARPGEVIYKLQ